MVIFDPISYKKASEVENDLERHKNSELDFVFRQLPDGTTNEVDFEASLLTQKISEDIYIAGYNFTRRETGDTDDFYAIETKKFSTGIMDLTGSHLDFKYRYMVNGYDGNRSSDNILFEGLNHLTTYISSTDDLRMKIPKSAYQNEWTLEETVTWIRENRFFIYFKLKTPNDIEIRELSANTVQFLYLVEQVDSLKNSVIALGGSV